MKPDNEINKLVLAAQYQDFRSNKKKCRNKKCNNIVKEEKEIVSEIMACYEDLPLELRVIIFETS